MYPKTKELGPFGDGTGLAPGDGVEPGAPPGSANDVHIILKKTYNTHQVFGKINCWTFFPN